jgi:O-antigen/teichoic acid export membrane protein
MICIGLFLPNFKNYLFAILPLLFAEVVNPYAIFLGLEKLKAYNLGNLISRIFALGMVFFFIKNIHQAPLVNFFVGISQLFVFTILMIYLVFTGEIEYGKVLIGRIRHFIQDNSSLTVSNVIVQFQQSIFLYALGVWHSGMVQGAYAIIDKLIWGGRMVLIAISNALYPSAISAHALGRKQWRLFRNNVNQPLALLLIAVGVLMFILAPFIATMLSFSDALDLVVYNIKCISILPFIIGMNMLNVLELIMENQYKRQMYLSLILMIISIFVSALFIFFIAEKYSIFYLVIIESICLILYEKNRYHTA